MSQQPQAQRPTKRPKTQKCVTFANPVVTNVHTLPTTLGDFLKMYSTSESTIKITLYENGKSQQVLKSANNAARIYPDPGKLKTSMKIRQNQFTCSRIENKIECFTKEMGEIDEALEYGDFPELEDGLRLKYISLEKQVANAQSMIQKLKQEVVDSKKQLYATTHCPSGKFLHILITNPTIVCPYKNSQVQVTKTCMLESFMCVDL